MTKKPQNALFSTNQYNISLITLYDAVVSLYTENRKIVDSKTVKGSLNCGKELLFLRALREWSR